MITSSSVTAEATTVEPESTDYRQRLQDFYATRGIEKDDQALDRALETWKGKERAMFVALEKKFPASNHRQRLKEFYAGRGVVKSDQDVDQALELWKGREKDMFVTLESKYPLTEFRGEDARTALLIQGNIAPQQDYSLSGRRMDEEKDTALDDSKIEVLKQRLREFYASRGIEKDDQALDKVLETWKGKERAMFVALEKKFPASNHLQRLKEFYASRGVVKSDQDVDQALELWKGREKDMFVALESKYPLTKFCGEDTRTPPTTQGNIAPQQDCVDNQATRIDCSKTEVVKQRLREFYASRGIEKDGQALDKVLETWKGEEYAMFVALEKKFPASNHRQRLKEFYASRGIVKSDQDVDQALELWKGREKDMFVTLEGKYPLSECFAQQQQ